MAKKRHRHHGGGGDTAVNATLANAVVHDETREARRLKIAEAALEENPVNISVLRSISLGMGGLGLHGPNNNVHSLRRRVWPRLLGVNPYEPSDHVASIFPHKDWNQVEMDINRSLIKYTRDMRTSLRKEWQDKLGRIVHAVHCRNPDLHYFQGFHDICTIFLLVCGEDLGFRLSEKVAQHHFRSAMGPDFGEIMKQIELLFSLIGCVDKELYDFLIESGVQPYFALAWVITWFSHKIDSVDTMARLFDFFIVSHPMMPLYVSAQAVISARSRVLQAECEFTAVHHLLANIDNTLPYEIVLSQAASLFHRFPPKDLATLAQVEVVPARYLLSVPELYPWLERQFRPDSVLIKESVRRERRELKEKEARRHGQNGKGARREVGEKEEEEVPSGQVWRTVLSSLVVMASTVASAVLVTEMANYGL